MPRYFCHVSALPLNHSVSHKDRNFCSLYKGSTGWPASSGLCRTHDSSASTMGFTQTFVKSSPFGETSVIVNQSIIVGIVAIYIVWIIYLESRRVKAPRVGKNPWISGLGRARADFFSNSKQLTREGYARYKNSMFWIQTGDMERLVLSNHYLDELRRLPDSYLDSKQAVVERNLGWYNRVDVILKSTAHVDVCRTQLVQNLGTYPCLCCLFYFPDLVPR